MIRAFALLLAALTMLAGASQAQAQGFFQFEDSRDIMGGGPGFFRPGNGQALRYGIGVGRDGFRWSGTHRITAKKEWPSWTPPAQMLRRRPDLPRHMPGGIDNPLGARAMYLGSTLYRIHGSNEPETIGQAVSSGCFRMTNEDVTDLYNRVRIGTPVIVRN